MTFEEFDKTAFCGNMWAMHEGEMKFVISCNFPERLFGLLPEKPSEDFDPEEISWVRCESVGKIEYRGGFNA